jgi:hypothetical protein
VEEHLGQRLSPCATWDEKALLSNVMLKPFQRVISGTSMCMNAIASSR